MQSPRPSIAYWNNIPSPYFVERMNAVIQRGNIDVTCWFNQMREPDRSWDVDESSWQFNHEYLIPRAFRGRTVYSPSVQTPRRDLLVSLYGEPSFVLGAFFHRQYAKRLAFRMLPTYDAWQPRARFKEGIKHTLFRMVDAVKVPGPDGESTARKYGVPSSRIFTVTQSIDVEHFASARRIDPVVREKERLQRGLTGCTFIYVGRLWHGKGLDPLFDAYRSLLDTYADVSLLIVGDGVDEQRYRDVARSMRGIHFEGFVQESDLPNLYALADVMVFPTLGDPHGLVVEEAMAAGLPVISSDAAGDIKRRLPDNEAGMIVPAGQAEPLARAMQVLAEDEPLRRTLRHRGGELVTSRSHESYALDFESFVEHTLNLPKRFSVADLRRNLTW